MIIRFVSLSRRYKYSSTLAFGLRCREYGFFRFKNLDFEASFKLSNMVVMRCIIRMQLLCDLYLTMRNFRFGFFWCNIEEFLKKKETSLLNECNLFLQIHIIFFVHFILVWVRSKKVPIWKSMYSKNNSYENKTKEVLLWCWHAW